MNVHGVGGILKSINYFSKTEQKGVSGSFSLNFNKIPHKGMQRPSDAEFDTIIDNMAKALAEAYHKKDIDTYDALKSKVRELRAQYVSIVSPDRKSMAEEAMPYLRGKTGDHEKSSDGPSTLIDYLNLKDGFVSGGASEGRYTVQLKSGSMVCVGGAFNPNVFEFKAHDGQTVLYYNDYSGWSYMSTPQEKMMENEFNNKINNAEQMYYYQLKNSFGNTASSAEQTFNKKV